MAKPIDLTGQKFGALTVTKRAENSGRYVAWYCDCECGTKNFVVRGYDLTRSNVKSCGCKEVKETDSEEKRRAKRKAKEDAKRLSEQEKIDWDELYQYVRSNIMGYDNSQTLSRDMCLRLKGLLTNKFFENKKQKNTANYSFKTILNTFKFCYPDIQKALRTMSFVDEMHKFNVVLKIVERNINTVYMRMKSIEKAKEEAENIATATVNYTGAEYQKKTTETNNKLLNDLW